MNSKEVMRHLTLFKKCVVMMHAGFTDRALVEESAHLTDAN